MASAIEDIIEELEEYIDSCKPAAFSSSKIVVNRDEIEVLLNDLKVKTPEEVRHFQKIISNQEAILADAKRQADNIIQKAQVQTTELLSEHQIMQQAYVKANEVVMIASKEAAEIRDSATKDANEIRQGAIAYTDDLLRQLQEIVVGSMETTRSTMESYMNTMQGYLNIITQNRIELSPSPAADVAVVQSVPQEMVMSPTPEENEIKPEHEVHTNQAQVPDDSSSEEYVDTLQSGTGVIDIPDQFFRKE